MAKPPPYSKARRTFRNLFLISTGVFFLLLLLALFFGTTYGSHSPGFPSAIPIDQIAVIGGITAALATCVTSAISLMGFVSTLVLGWRKEARDASAADLERKRLEVELEKQKLELSKLKAEEAKKEKSVDESKNLQEPPQ